MEANLIEELCSYQDNRRALTARTVETYPPAWVVVHETLQNSLDAIQKSGKEQGHVQVHLNLDRQEVNIRDNGTGFPFNLNYLGLGGTDKDSMDWRFGGNIGVGLTVVILSTNDFQLETVFEGKTWNCKVADAWKYLSGEVDDVCVKYDKPIPLETPQEEYTAIRYAFPDSKVTDFIHTVYAEYVPLVPNTLAVSELDKFKLALEYYFRTQSYAGNVNRLIGGATFKHADISLIIEARKTDTLEVLEEGLRQIIRSNQNIVVNFSNKHWDVVEAIGRARSGASTPAIIQNDVQEGGKVGGPYSQNYIYVKSFTTQPQFESLLQNRHLRERVDIEAYRSLFDQLSGIYCVIGSSPVLKNFLMREAMQFIAASGIPSAHLLDKPSRGGELGYLANVHLILNLKAKLNYGKQTVSNTRLVGISSKFFNDAFRATLKNIAKEFVGTLPQPPPPIAPIGVVQRRDLNLPGFSIVKEPAKEQDVIALFYELVGKGYLKEYRTYALSSFSQYDARMMLKYPGDSDFLIPTIDAQIPNVEFKVKVSAIISEFEEGDKNAQEITALIVWEQDYSNTHPDYEVIDVVGTSMEDLALNNVDQCMHQRSSGHMIQLLVLKKLVSDIRAGVVTP